MMNYGDDLDDDDDDDSLRMMMDDHDTLEGPFVRPARPYEDCRLRLSYLRAGPGHGPRRLFATSSRFKTHSI